MSTYYYPGSMANLTADVRETDFRIRLDLGLPMRDDAGDFLGVWTSEIEERDETITDLNQRIEDLEKDATRDAQEIEDLHQEIRQLEAQLKART